MQFATRAPAGVHTWARRGPPEDEHGWALNYRKGCRCPRCRNASRVYEYRLEHGWGKDLRDAVLRYRAAHEVVWPEWEMGTPERYDPSYADLVRAIEAWYPGVPGRA